MTVSFLRYLIDKLFGGCNKSALKWFFDQKNLDNKDLSAQLFPITVCMIFFTYPLSNQYQSAYDLFKTQPEKCLMAVGNKYYNNRLQWLTWD